MKTSRLGVYASILHLFIVGLLYSDISSFDGNEWRGHEETFKLGYAYGYISACNYVTFYNQSMSFETSFGSWSSEKQQQGLEAFDRLVSLRYSADSMTKLISPLDCWLAILHDGTVNNAYRSHYSIMEISVGQIVDGLDELYNDFKNRSIKVTDAVYVVKKQIQGASQREIDLILRYLRGGKEARTIIFVENGQGKSERIEFP